MKELIVTPFLEDELFIVTSNQHPLVQKEETTIADLQNQQWIMRENGSGTREYFNHVVRSNGLKVKSLLTISSNQGIKETLINGLGISILSGSVVERDVKQNNLSIIKVKNQEFKRTLSYVLSPIMQEKKNVSIFIEALGEKWKHPKGK
jgi:DNA-binding transcriptional LysR family regulator